MTNDELSNKISEIFKEIEALEVSFNKETTPRYFLVGDLLLNAEADGNRKKDRKRLFNIESLQADREALATRIT